MNDITDPKKAFDRIDKLDDILNSGFMALAMDYGYYVESVFLSNKSDKHRIYELRDSVSYRFKSAKFHLLLLIREKGLISHQFKNMMEKEPNVFSKFIMGNPHFERAEDKIMSIYDSIIFHLSSAFDYLSILINFNFGEKKQSPLKWIQLAKSCRDENNPYSKMSFAKIIDEKDRDFISSFNEYRTELIHRKNSKSFTQLNWNKPSGETEVKFLCSSKLQKRFKKIIKSDEENTIALLSLLLIEKSIVTICEVLLSLRNEYKDNHTIASNIQTGAPALILIDPTTKRPMSPGEGFWKGVEKAILEYKSQEK